MSLGTWLHLLDADDTLDVPRLRPRAHRADVPLRDVTHAGIADRVVELAEAAGLYRGTMHHVLSAVRVWWRRSAFLDPVWSSGREPHHYPRTPSWEIDRREVLLAAGCFPGRIAGGAVADHDAVA